jgi:hypothetical protein
LFDDNQDLDDRDGTDGSQAKFDQRFRIQPVFKITDRLTLNTKFEALDRVNWGGTADSIDMERAWVDAEFDMFTLKFGRMQAGTCGLSYCNSDGDADRIKVVLKDTDPFYLDFTYSKYIEADYNTTTGAAGAGNDQDMDGYAIMGSYKVEGVEAGVLVEFVSDGSPVHGAVAQADAKQRYTIIDPFVKAVFGPVTVEAEAQWYTGDYLDFDNSATTDIDYDAKRYLLDVGVDLGVATVGVGYAHSVGRSNTETDFTNAGFGGNDWEPLIILTGFWDHGAGGLGSVANLNEKNKSITAASDTDMPDLGTGTGPATLWSDAGYNIFYIYGSFSPMEDITISAIVGSATADETSRFAAGVDDDIGTEFDVRVKWQVMDNMVYDIGFGFFSPDDFWKAGDSTSQVDDSTWSIVNTVMVTF